ncbi:sensor domain-containing diguanylate cyclase [Sphingomonas sp.]|uniref:sensor domain-containing diguanylate cyclase n=1 Tax=Sphingomonas sp. TaxID=28214 RepID=UPI0017C416FC|nr:sensor domain-containing diguanylate cyclase [Sphingomonas sp.]MBA4763075.1 diguanylate cyclase [Sphingomonas sp.]
MRRSSLFRTDLLVVAAVAMVYFLCAAAAIAFTILSGNVALLWIANAVLIAALLTRPATERPLHVASCFAASVAASVAVSPYIPLAPLFGVANIAETLIAWALLRRFNIDARLFLSLRALGVFVATAGVIAPLASGVIPAAALALYQGADPWVVWISWGIGHGLGALICTPIALLALAGTTYRDRFSGPAALPRFFGIALLMIAVTSLSFAQARLPLLFVPVLPLIAATMAFRVAGATLGVFAIALIGAAFTVAGTGPLQMIDGTEAFRLQFFQFYLSVLFLIAVPFATMIAQNQRLAASVAVSEARYRLISDHVSDVVLTLDPHGAVQFASPSMREVTGHAPETIIGKSPAELVHEVDRDRVREAYRRVMAEPETVHRFEFRGHTATGGIRWFETTARAVRDADRAVLSVVTVVREVSHRKAREADLLRQANTDPMTGVLNRRAFQDRIDRFRTDTPERPGTLALFDLDHFKQVNDGHGHDAGDAALLHFADVLRANLRVEDVIGRLGGEEFAVLFPGLSTAAAMAACERVRNSLQDARIHAGDTTFTITVSAGVAPIRPDLSSDEVFRVADAALYRAKSAGRNRSELAAA